MLRLAARILGTEDRGDLWADDHFIGKTLDFLGYPGIQNHEFVAGGWKHQNEGRRLLGC